MFKLRTRSIVISGTALLLGGLGLIAYTTTQNNAANAVPRVAVTAGTVERVISVSGTIRSDNTGRLSFATPGTIAQVAVTEGDTVTRGDTLATLTTQSIDEDIRGAQAALVEAIASQQELLAGPTQESRQVIDTNVAIAEQQLARTQNEQQRLIENARRTLLSTDLMAEPVDEEERVPTPTISGTYRCEATGTYHFSVFRSNAESGFSIRVQGLEETTVPVSFTQAVPFGICGLRVQFTESVHLNRTNWNVPVPNRSSSQYISNLNALESAEETARNAITAATEALDLAQKQRQSDTAPTRNEQRKQADARIAQAEAQLARLNQRRVEHTLRAPFDGTVTEINSIAGEAVSSAPVVTLVGTSGTLELRTRVPEVDITKLTLGQTARAYFDAEPTDPQTGTITYIAPTPTDIDGVAYFTAHITLDEQPAWLRPGLNADVDIIITEQTEVPRLPIGFILLNGDSGTVRVEQNGTIRTEYIPVPLIGTNGYAAVRNLSLGDVIVAPAN